MTLQALTLDLDDTLWPVWPCIRRAEALLRDWLVQQAPATAAAHDPAAMRAIREAVLRDRPDWQHDLSALRREGLRRALLAACIYLAFFCTFRYGRTYLTSAPETFWLNVPIIW